MTMPFVQNWVGFLAVLLALLAGNAGVRAAELPASIVLASQLEFSQRIKPILSQYCYDCHADGAHKGGFSLDKNPSFKELVADQKNWNLVRQQVSAFVMPPAKKDQPTSTERAAILSWIDDSVFYCDPKRPDPGHVVLRRLNRTEYANTIRDLFSLNENFAVTFPADDTGYGFDNIGDVLSVSPVLMEKLLRASREVSTAAFATVPPARFKLEKGGEKLQVIHGKPESLGTSHVLASIEDEVGLTIPNLSDALYRIGFKLNTPTLGNRVRAAVLLDGKPWQELEVAATAPPVSMPASQPTTRTANRNRRPSGPKPLALTVALPHGTHTISVKLIDPDTKLALSSISLDGPISVAPARPSAFLQQITPSRAYGIPTISASGELFEQGQGKSGLDTGAMYLASAGAYRHFGWTVLQAGKYRFRVKAGAQQAGDENVRFNVRLGDTVIKTLTVTEKAQAPQLLDFVAEIPAGTHDLQIALDNYYRDPTTKADRWLWLHEVTIDGPLDTAQGVTKDEIPALIAKIGERIFRRPLTAEQQSQLVRLSKQALAAEQSPTEALQTCVQAMLVSPKFLFRGSEAENVVKDGSSPVDEFALASRLSYFLWSSTPDDRLLQLAAQTSLRANLAPEVKRMLVDPRAHSLTTNFAGQWLQLRDVTTMSPDKQAFPDFTPQIAADMRTESETFFEHILRDDRSVMEFLSADYTFANARLAAFYGLPAVKGEAFEKVSLAGTHRRGVLTQGSILLLTSHPTRTSPVKRGKFVLEKILGASTPPQPQDVPPLKEDGPDLTTMTLRHRFEAHRANPACASCHAFLDPIGFALENFDAVGRFRTVDGGQPVDASGKLVTGEQFKDVSDLDEILLTQKRDDFVRALSENLLTYALGRGLEYTDKLAVQRIVESTKRADYRFGDMILAVCQSVPFERVRATDAQVSMTSGDK